MASMIAGYESVKYLSYTAALILKFCRLLVVIITGVLNGR